ncbi:hypothetical protein FB451DRAFT_675494 [Mycena latifolia]|nr:hypothetical protein FB451DRAFT_675494 [Mycena latifolia]
MQVTIETEIEPPEPRPLPPLPADGPILMEAVATPLLSSESLACSSATLICGDVSSAVEPSITASQQLPPFFNRSCSISTVTLVEWKWALRRPASLYLLVVRISDLFQMFPATVYSAFQLFGSLLLLYFIVLGDIQLPLPGLRPLFAVRGLAGAS